MAASAEVREATLLEKIGAFHSMTAQALVKKKHEHLRINNTQIYI